MFLHSADRNVLCAVPYGNDAAPSFPYNAATDMCHQGGATASRMAVELLAKELGAARGDFDAAIRKQKDVSIRVTEEMQAVADSMDLAPTMPGTESPS